MLHLDSVQALKKRLVKHVVAIVFDDRKNFRTNPDGKWGSKRRWIPSAREDGDNLTSRIRSQSSNWPFSYFDHARTRKHIYALAAVDLEYIVGLAARSDPNVAEWLVGIREREAIVAAAQAQRDEADCAASWVKANEFRNAA
jgi:hypothetical protein